MFTTYHKIGTIATGFSFTVALVTAFTIAVSAMIACGGGTLDVSCAPDELTCPADAYEMCEPTATPTTCCGTEGTPRPACKVDAGILTNTCPGCAPNSGPCAIAPDGAVTCAIFTGGAK